MPAARPLGILSSNAQMAGDESPATRRKGKVSALRSIGNAIKRSPKIVRKAFGSTKDKKRLQVGRGKAESDLSGCKDNGWLHTDADVFQGINYKVKYLGSVEVDFDPSETTNNQEHAQKAMRALRLHHKGCPGAAQKLVLKVSVGNMQLASPEGEVIMRHSTTRIAYSTVDTENPKLFAYVAMVKGSELTLAHIFKVKSPKQGYEMTFSAAQAFDLNYRRWQENSDAALTAARVAEGGDVEPTKAWQKKKDPAAAADDDDKPARGSSPLGGPAESAADLAAKENSGPGRSASAASSVTDEDRTLPATRSGSALPGGSVSPSRDPVFLAMSGEDAAKKAAAYFASIGIQMIEDDDDDEPPAAVSAHTLAPNLFEIGVDPAAYNAAAAADESAGYFTVGATNPFANDDDDDDDIPDDDEDGVPF